MSDYYSKKLSANRLQRCYEIAPPRVKQYLEAEINHVVNKINSNSMVLELGCGYGRVLPPLTKIAKHVVGIDFSFSSLEMGKDFLQKLINYDLVNMSAGQLGFANNVFDFVVCIQNGISAFHIPQLELIKESLRVTKSGGLVLFSTYTENFWKDRLQWFQLQSDAGLLGEIDYQKTGDGNIVCKDGFTASTISKKQFEQWGETLELDYRIEDIDHSSLFFEIEK